MTLQLKPAAFDASLRSHVVGASTSVLSRLSLLHMAALSSETIVPLRAMLQQCVDYVEQTLQELVAVFPEPETDLEGNTSVGAAGSVSAQEKVSLNDVGVHGGNANVLTTPAVLLDERERIDEMQQSNDPNTLRRCIALLRLQVVESEVAMHRQKEEWDALVASHKRRCDGFDVSKGEMEREILSLRRTSLGQEPRVMQDMFSTIDVLTMLCGGSSHTAELTDANLVKRMEEVIGIFMVNVDARKSVSEARMQAALDRIADVEARRLDAETRVRNLGARMHEQEDRAKRDMVAMERKQRDLRNKIIELEQKLQTDKAAWIALERELDTVRGDKEALIQAVSLAEAKAKQQRHDLYVHIATISQQLLVEQKKYTMSYEEEADPLNVDLVNQIADSGFAQDLSDETLQRLLAVTQRPDDPSKLAAQDNLSDRCDNLRKDVRAWKSVALESGLQLQLKTVEKTDLEEDLLRVIGFSKDNNLPVPLDLVKSRLEAEHINAFDDNTNFKEICRTLRTDAKVASKRLHEIRERMDNILPLAERTAKGDALAEYDARQKEKDGSAASALLAQNAAFARGVVGSAVTPRQQEEAKPRDDLGSLLEEVERTERIESKMREKLLENAKTIRQLTIDKQYAEKTKVQERITWVDQWCTLLSQLPPMVTDQLNLAGLTVLEGSPIVLEEFSRIKSEHKEAMESEKKVFFDQIEKEREKLVTLAKEAQDAKAELAEERQRLAALDPAAARRRSMKAHSPKADDGSDHVDDDEDAVSLTTAGSGVFDMWKKPIVTADAEVQAQPEACEQETTTTDAVLYNRQFKSKDMETTRLRLSERGSQVHVEGEDKELQCELAPKFDREVAEELFSDIGRLFEKTKTDPMLDRGESPPRCGSPAFPKRFLCPSCGETISYVSKGLDGVAKVVQTEVLEVENTTRRSTIRRSTASSPILQQDKYYFVFEALNVEALDADDLAFVAKQARTVCETHGGTLRDAVSTVVDGCSLLASFSDAMGAVRCAMALHEFQRESTPATVAPTPRSIGSTPRLLDSSRSNRSASALMAWPRCRSAIATSAELSMRLCDVAYAQETTVENCVDLSTVLGSAPLNGDLSVVRRAATLRDAASPRAQAVSATSSAAVSVEESSLLASTTQNDTELIKLPQVYQAEAGTTTPQVQPQPQPQPSALSDVLSVVRLIHADRRDHFHHLPTQKESYALGRRKLLRSTDATYIPFERTLRDGHPSTLMMSHAEEEFLCDIQDQEVQTEPVVILNDEEFHQWRARSTSRSGTPLQSQRPVSTSRIPKPSSANTLNRRPSTAGIKKLGESIGIPVRNDFYVDALMQLWKALDPFIPDHLRVAPQRAFSPETMPIVPLLLELAAMFNVRALIGLEESEAEQLMKVHCLTSLQQVFQDLQLTDFTLPVRIPYTVAVRCVGSETLAAHVPLLFSTAISDAFRPILHLLSRAGSAKVTSAGNGGLMSFTRPNTPASDTAAAETALGTDKKRCDVNAIHARLSELESLLHDALEELHVSPPQILPASSPPPMLSAYLGWEAVPMSKPPSPVGAEQRDRRRGSPIRGGTTRKQHGTVDSDGFMIVDEDGGMTPRGRISRVLVKHAHPTVSIPKFAVVEGLGPQITGSSSSLLHLRSGSSSHHRQQHSSGNALHAGRAARPLLKSLPLKGQPEAAPGQLLPLPQFVPPSQHAFQSQDKERNEASQMLLRSKLPPMSALVDVFTETFGRSSNNPRTDKNENSFQW